MDSGRGGAIIALNDHSSYQAFVYTVNTSLGPGHLANKHYLMIFV